MPRGGPRRPTMTFRISDAGLQALAAVETVYRLNRSEVTRRMVAFGLENPQKVLGDPPADEPAADGAA